MIYILQLAIWDIDYFNGTVLAASESPSLLGKMKNDIITLVNEGDENKLAQYIGENYNYIPNPRVNITKDQTSPENLAKDLILYMEDNIYKDQLLEIIPINVI